MTAADRQELLKALVGPVKLDSGLASQQLADMALHDLESITPVINHIELEAFRSGWAAGLKQGLRVAKRPERDDLEPAAQIAQRLLRRGATA